MNKLEKKAINEATDLATLVDYMEGSVVSREIIKNTGGTVTVFAFDQGQGLSEHTAPFDAMVTVLDGKAVIHIGGNPHIVSSGKSIIMPANIPHALFAEEKFKMQLIMIKSMQIQQL